MVEQPHQSSNPSHPHGTEHAAGRAGPPAQSETEG